MLNVDRFERMLQEGLICAHEWRATDANGREMLCALAALSADVADAKRASACSAADCAPWFAELVPWIDDVLWGTEYWRPAMERLARLARSGVLSSDAMTTLDYVARAICVREAMAHTADQDAVSVCSAVVALCDRAAAGDIPAPASWSAEAAAAAKAAAAAAAAKAEAWAAEAARMAAAKAARMAAAKAAKAAAAANAAAAAAAAAAANRIVTAIFDAIEAA